MIKRELKMCVISVPRNVKCANSTFRLKASNNISVIRFLKQKLKYTTQKNLNL